MSTNAPSPISYHPTFLSGQTLDTNFAPVQPPFNIKSLPKLFDQKEFKEIPLTQNGSQEETFQLVMNSSDKVSSLGISGELDMTCGPVTGDANVKFAMDNINSGLSLSIIYRNSVTGKIKTVDLNDLDSLELADQVKQQIDDGLTFNEFVEAYGQYIIIGFKSGGEILYDCTYSTKDSSDKLSVSGGLSLAYNDVPGFNVSGSVNGDFKQQDIQKSLDVKTSFRIDPSSDSKDQTELINNLNKLTSIAQTAKSENKVELVDLKNNIDAAAQAILNPEISSDTDLNWSKAIIYPIGSIPCVSAAFAKQELEDERISGFLQYLNRLFIDIKSKSQDMEAMTDKWPKNEQSKLFITYAVKFEQIIQLIETFTDYQVLAKYGKDYNTYIQGGGDDNEDDTKQESKEDDILDNKQIDIPTDEFYKINIILLDSQYDDDIFTPFNEYMNKISLTASLSVAVDDIVTVNLSQNNGDPDSYTTIINQFVGWTEQGLLTKTIDSIEISSKTVLQFICTNTGGAAGFMALIELSNGKQYATPDGYFTCEASANTSSNPSMYRFNPIDWRVQSGVFPDNASFIWPNNDQKADDKEIFIFKFSDVIST
mmetsp:Transcript_22931/g.20146  ORF Transcript_22931/g.20146 Transcript_22931/m.20146 type:complete len:596 (+) Transcript_22931:60-1847(+)|eukprot:CAMPEP_0201580246 /NCGR_PEP_ID=MMETSP0190_2-20130828/40188_1 /ASSEMBLY_ACC=CAM_ASM_000263 /TAXON_ID=37353 /ORGANISM="Rosalina sp." /LENGTH=595 /DNA_ID=CAMNT_0048015923 /DNA_START=65 /DNA_END=1852 /DNA_ORIENTATION=+